MFLKFASDGARDGTRTHDLLITNQLRYQLRHSSLFFLNAAAQRSVWSPADGYFVIIQYSDDVFKFFFSDLDFRRLAWETARDMIFM